MKHQQLNFGLLLMASLPLGVQAQDNAVESNTDTTVSRQIEIVKEYNPTINAANKISVAPTLKDDETKKINVAYSVWSTPFTPGNDSVPSLDYALASKTNKAYRRSGYIKLGGGNYTSFIGETYLPLYQSKKNLFEIQGTHNSSFGKVRFTNDLYKDLAEDYRTKAKINDNFWKAIYTHNIRAKELSAYADFGLNAFNYYGYDGRELKDRDNIEYKRDQRFTNFDAGVRFRTKKFIEKWQYDVQTNYQLFHTYDGLSEHNIYTNGNVDYRVDNGYLTCDLDMYNTFLNLPTDSVPFDYKHSQNTDNATVLILRPAYVVKGKNSELHVGVKGAFSFGQGRPASVMPDLTGSIAISPKYWFLYAGITGDHTVNNYRNMAKRNRYIALDNRAEDTYTPIDVYLGSKVNLFKYALLDVHVGYKVINNPYFFVGDITDTLETNAKGSFYNLTYGKDDGLFTAGLDITTNWREYAQLTLKGKYNNWAMSKGETAWMMPTTEFTANLSVLPIEDLRIWIAYNYQGGRKALFATQYGTVTRNMKDINDLSLGATYKAMSWLNVFCNVNNILSSEYDYWYGYANQHLNVMGGVIINF